MRTIRSVASSRQEIPIWEDIGPWSFYITAILDEHLNHPEVAAANGKYQRRRRPVAQRSLLKVVGADGTAPVWMTV
jgi:hypothetical protein